MQPEMTKPQRRWIAAATLVLTLAGCSSLPLPRQDAEPLLGPQSVTRPPVDATFDYQIGGSYAPASAAAGVDRDRHEFAVAGAYSICYLNAFQTQPDELAYWKQHHGSLLLKKGERHVTDPGWPGEYLLNTSTVKKRAAIARVVGGWIDGCATAGYRAVEPDNLDSWTRSRGRLSRSDNLALAKLLVGRAHAAGLAIAQKNAAELGDAGRFEVGFDFAIAEECQVYDECGDYTDVYGNNVIEIEYADNPHRAYRQACAARGDDIAVILRDRDVVAHGRPGYVYRSC